MYNYAISFSLKTNSTYGERYQSLMHEIRQTPGATPWTETTSFALLSTRETLGQLADRLYYRTSVNAVTDILLVFDPNSSAAIVRGPVTNLAQLSNKFRYFSKL